MRIRIWSWLAPSDGPLYSSYHSDEESGLLSSTTHTSVTDNADGEASRQTGETDTEAGAQLDEGRKEWQLLGEVVGDQDRHDQPVDTDDTSHDDWDDVFSLVSSRSSVRRR